MADNSIYDPEYPVDGPSPECPIEALADALEEAYSFGRLRDIEPDWALMANNLAAEIRRQGYLMAVSHVRGLARLWPKVSSRADLEDAAAQTELAAPGEAP